MQIRFALGLETPPPFTGPMSERPKPFRSLQLPTHFGVHFCTHHVLALVSTRRCVVFCTHLCTFSTQSFLESAVESSYMDGGTAKPERLKTGAQSSTLYEKCRVF